MLLSSVDSVLTVFSELRIMFVLVFFFFQAEDGIRDLVRSRGLGDVYKRQPLTGFNLVSLLIGVNNQFQGGSSTAYANEFEDLLLSLIHI